MNERPTIYYFVIGAFGGLNGWFLSVAVLSKTNTYVFNNLQASSGAVYSLFILGGILGACIGGAASVCNIFGSRPLAQVIKSVAIGILLGTLAGGVALTASHLIYGALLARVMIAAPQRTGISFMIGLLCWAIFGSVMGFGSGLNKGTKSYKRLLCAVLGGLAGGLLYEAGRASAFGEASLYGQQIFLALALALLGGAIGVSAALANTALKFAYIEVLSGEHSGRRYDVMKYVSGTANIQKPCIIGSDKISANIYLPADGKVLPHHAALGHTHGIPFLSKLPESDRVGVLLVNGRPASRVSLADGDQLQMGSTMLLYRHKHI
jgi:hypothetical protein